MKIVAFLVGFSSLVLGANADCCKNGWLSYEGHCYYIGYETLLTFTSAWAYCDSRGAYLVRLETPGEYLFVKEYLKKTGARTPWISEA
ncbi:snaclec agkisacutacin subunit A-like [Ruditapes philippinarum]|uniref:snaclec agkisacutacin subunit A-like n=1 Tax=Ruditapes philippinarum TaxID=129788 RepID=UPI00295B4099|nr:snaclec agkisacutacin subunit A-like [Ruditapes philippinarum]